MMTAADSRLRRRALSNGCLVLYILEETQEKRPPFCHKYSSSSSSDSMALSLRRADAVRAALIVGGISPDAITVAGRGESEPAVPTPDGVKEQVNRRVEIIV
jgi:hypothetical protein